MRGALTPRLQIVSSLPPLPPLPPAAPAVDVPALPEAPGWSPLWVSVALYAAVWACFAFLAPRATYLRAADVGRLDHILATGAAVVGLVLVTLSVVHTQVSGIRPRPTVVAAVALGLLQGRVAAAMAAGPSDVWGPAAHIFALIGLAVPLAWVGGQFQQGVRRQRVERTASLVASWVERARRQAHQTVDSAQRHDVRSTLFVIDGAARSLTDPRASLSDEQRIAFSEMLTESVARLAALTDARSEEIQPFGLDGVARAVAHAERKAGRTVGVDVPGTLRARGRAADVAAVLRTLTASVGRACGGSVQLRTENAGAAVVIRVEPAGADHLPLLSRSWGEVWAESFNLPARGDEEAVDLYVAARLLADQGADLWATADRSRFAVRLPADEAARAEDQN